MGTNRAEYMREYYQKNKEHIQAYKREYSKNNMYKRFKKICAFVDRDLCEKFENKLLEDKINITDFITKKIEEYVKE